MEFGNGARGGHQKTKQKVMSSLPHNPDPFYDDENDDIFNSGCAGLTILAIVIIVIFTIGLVVLIN